MENLITPTTRTAGLGAVVLLLFAGVAAAGVTLVEPGHVLVKRVDTCAPTRPSHMLLDTACALGTIADIESIGVKGADGTLFVQLADVGAPSTDSCIFAISPTSVVSVINPSTGFGINERGTDLLYDRSSNLLVTMNDNSFFSSGVEEIATVNPSNGATGTYTTLPPGGIFLGATLGIDISRGAGGTDVPLNELVFTGDLTASGIHSSPQGGPHTTHLVTAAGGDDMVIQPDGDWVWVGDFLAPITAYSPTAGHVAAPSLLDIQTIFTAAGRPFVHGSRATVCDGTGELYVSYSGSPGGSAIFRVDEPLLTATHVLDIGPNDGLQDLTVGPSTVSAGGSLYFTVHDSVLGCEQVWELTLPECRVPLYVSLESFTASVVPEGVRLSWTTTREADNAGFRVLREREGVKRAHPTVMTPTLIPPQGTELTGSTYVWTDTTKQPPGVVLYYLEDVDVFGRVTRHGPVRVELPRELDIDVEYREKPSHRTRGVER